jgi:tripartite-type tricarboxylate transporter receptor subunit TctC
VAAEEPDPLMPDAPTMKSQGYDVLAASYTGLVAPAGTPPDVVDTLTQAIRTVVNSPEHKQKLLQLGVSPYYLGPKDYTKLWIDNETRMAPLVGKLQGR